MQNVVQDRIQLPFFSIKNNSSIKEAVTRQNGMFPKLFDFLHKSHDKQFHINRQSRYTQISK